MIGPGSDKKLRFSAWLQRLGDTLVSFLASLSWTPRTFSKSFVLLAKIFSHGDLLRQGLEYANCIKTKTNELCKSQTFRNFKSFLSQGLYRNNINGSKLETDIKTGPRKVLITGDHQLWILSTPLFPPFLSTVSLVATTPSCLMTYFSLCNNHPMILLTQSINFMIFVSGNSDLLFSV